MTKEALFGKRILHIDDDHELAEVVKSELEPLGYEVSHASDGAEGLAQAVDGTFDLVILDLQMPSMNGFDVLRELRKKDEYVSVLMLTSQSGDADKVIGLELGADDYLTKPFQLPELRARVRAILRRVAALSAQALPEQEERLIGHDELQIDLDARRVIVRGEEVALTPLEFDMLAYLAAAPGRVFTREQILDHVWGVEISDYNASINSLVRRLRVKIEANPLEPMYIITVRGVGFKFKSSDE